MRKRVAVIASAAVIVAVVAVGLVYSLLSGGDTAKAEPRQDVPYGFWVSDAASAKDALAKVSAHSGVNLTIPAAIPPGYSLRAVAEVPLLADSSFKRLQMDFHTSTFSPPQPGKPTPPGEPHIQVQILTGEFIELGDTSPISLEVPGVRASSLVLTASQKQVTGNTTAGLYQLMGQGRTWTVRVSPSQAPSEAELMAFLKSLVQ